MSLSPLTQYHEDGYQTTPIVAKGIFNSWRHFGVECARHNPLLLQFTQLLDQHLLGNVAHQTPQFAIAFGFLAQMPQNEELPFTP